MMTKMKNWGKDYCSKGEKLQLGDRNASSGDALCRIQLGHRGRGRKMEGKDTLRGLKALRIQKD